MGHCCGKADRASQRMQGYRGTLYRVCMHQIEGRRGAARFSTSQGSAEPVCARIMGTNLEIPERKAYL